MKCVAEKDYHSKPRMVALKFIKKFLKETNPSFREGDSVLFGHL